jgi:hypothetical protein
MGTLEELFNRPYAEVWLSSLRERKRCVWCGQSDKPLNKAGLCASCKRVENKITTSKATLEKNLEAPDSFGRSLLARDLKVAEKMKELCESDGETVRAILDHEQSSIKLEDQLCEIAFVVSHDRNLHNNKATLLGQTFSPSQRQVFSYLLWEIFHADGRRKRMKQAADALALEAGSPMS